MQWHGCNTQAQKGSAVRTLRLHLIFTYPQLWWVLQPMSKCLACFIALRAIANMYVHIYTPLLFHLWGIACHLDTPRKRIATFNFCFILLLHSARSLSHLSGCSSTFMRAAILCRLFSRVSFYLYSIFFVCCFYCRYVCCFSYQLSFIYATLHFGSFWTRLWLSVWYGSSVVIRWHITLKCLLLFYKINFCEAHMSGQQQQQQQQRGKRIITWCQFHLLPLSLTEKKVQRKKNKKRPKITTTVACFIIGPQKVFALNFVLEVWAVELRVCVFYF